VKLATHLELVSRLTVRYSHHHMALFFITHRKSSELQTTHTFQGSQFLPLSHTQHLTHPSLTLSSGGPIELHHIIQAACCPDNLLMTRKFNLFTSYYRNLGRKKIMLKEKVQNVIIQRSGLLLGQKRLPAIRNIYLFIYLFYYLFPSEQKFCTEKE